MVNSLVESTPPPGGKEENTPSFDVDVHFFFSDRSHPCLRPGASHIGPDREFVIVGNLHRLPANNHLIMACTIAVYIVRGGKAKRERETERQRERERERGEEMK